MTLPLILMTGSGDRCEAERIVCDDFDRDVMCGYISVKSRRQTRTDGTLIHLSDTSRMAPERREPFS